MRYKTRSIIIARKKKTDKNDDLTRPVFVSLFDKDNPHLIQEAPIKVIEFNSIHKVIIKSNEINYLPWGNDIYIDNLRSVDLEEDNRNHLIISVVNLSKSYKNFSSSKDD